MSDQTGSVSSDDRLWSALGYPIALIAIIMLLMEEKKKRPFIKFHAVQAIAFNVVVWVLIFVLSFVTLGFGALCVPVLWLATLWPAIDSYRGNYTQIPVITNFIKKQGWA
ncbi:MAG: DUF4870 domain-containing protein [Anaerolineales bacterium]|nr:DUF4870 domain-containing protein [Anaerolineales bacterium]